MLSKIFITIFKFLIILCLGFDLCRFRFGIIDNYDFYLFIFEILWLIVFIIQDVVIYKEKKSQLKS